jgi:hypothetical protein
LNTVKRTTLFSLLLAIPVFLVPAQTNTTTNTKSNFFDLSGAPQWVRDLRRWEIVAFGTIPFAMFTATFGMDMYRWNKENGMDFSDNGRKYAPWPLKAAGAIAMEYQDMEKTLMIAAGICVTVAVTDLIITQIKRHKARKRIEAMPHNATTINKRLLQEDAPTPQEEAQAHETETGDDAAGDLEAPSP